MLPYQVMNMPIRIGTRESRLNSLKGVSNEEFQRQVAENQAKLPPRNRQTSGYLDSRLKALKKD